jgi:hypothetical protein
MARLTTEDRISGRMLGSSLPTSSSTAAANSLDWLL